MTPCCIIFNDMISREKSIRHITKKKEKKKHVGSTHTNHYISIYFFDSIFPNFNITHAFIPMTPTSHNLSLDFVHRKPNFYSNKLSIALNYAYKYFYNSTNLYIIIHCSCTFIITLNFSFLLPCWDSILKAGETVQILRK